MFQTDEIHRVFLVDDHAMIRQGVAAMIDDEADLTVCGEAANVAEAIDLIGKVLPEVVVLDLSLPDGSGVEVLRAIREQGLHVSPIILSSHDSLGYAEPLSREGAVGYVDKHDQPHAIIDAIHQVIAGGTYF